MARHGLAQEAFGGWQVTVLAEPELDGVTDTVYGSMEIHPLATNLDIGLIHMPYVDGPFLARTR